MSQLQKLRDRLQELIKEYRDDSCSETAYSDGYHDAKFDIADTLQKLLDETYIPQVGDTVKHIALGLVGNTIVVDPTEAAVDFGEQVGVLAIPHSLLKKIS